MTDTTALTALTERQARLREGLNQALSDLHLLALSPNITVGFQAVLREAKARILIVLAETEPKL